MLTIANIRSISYYTGLGVEDYYIAGGEPPGKWVGLGATELGLRGEVVPSDLEQLLAGFDPAGNPLCDNAGSDKHLSGNDICMSPGKSVSVVFARSPEPLRTSIQHAHFDAVKTALGLIEKYASVARRGHDGRLRERVAGIVCATFEHSTSREMDPQLHTHALVLNVALRDDGSWGTIENRHHYLWLRSADAFYKAKLAANLRRLGFSLDVNEKSTSFEISGVPSDVCYQFSKRGQQVKRGLEIRGLKNSSSRSGDFVTLSTRKKKTAIEREHLHKQWEEEMDRLGFTENVLKHSLQKQPGVSSLLRDEPTELLDVPTLHDLLTESKAVFEEREIFQKAAELALGSQMSVSMAEHCANMVINDRETVSLGFDFRHSRIFTSVAQLSDERALVANAKYLRKESGFGLEDDAVQAAINSISIRCSEEQLETIFNVCQEHRLECVQGSAGAGKSTTMQAVRIAYENAGFHVIGAAVAKAAADNLAREAKMQTSTIARILSDIERGRKVLTHNTVLIVDEAGQVGTRQLGALAKYARKHGSKLVLVGDDKQLDAIQHGGMLRYLSRPDVMGTSRITTIRRQREPWARQTVADLRDGNAHAALSSLDQRGLLFFSADQQSACESLVEQWKGHSELEPERTSLVLAQQWKDVEKLSNLIREVYRSNNRLGSRCVSLNCIVGKREQKLDFAEGDRVRFTYNDYSKGLTNGVLGEMVRIKELADGDIQFVVKDDTGINRTFLHSEYCDADGRLQMIHAYACTVYASQGLTVDETFVLHDVQMDRASGYVAGSRHRNNCRWFFNTMAVDEIAKPVSHAERLSYLAESLSSDRYQNTALEMYERHALRQSKERVKELSNEPARTLLPS